MKEFLSLDASCIIDSQGSFVYVNEPFLTLFDNVSEQSLYNMSIQDLIHDPILKKTVISIASLPFSEFTFINPNNKNIFSCFLAITQIPNSTLRVISIKSISKVLTAKRSVTSFRRYADRQIAVICFEFGKDEQLITLEALNLDLIDDNPSFVINLGNQIYKSIFESGIKLDNYTGLINPFKLETNNWLAISYIFQLLTPSNTQDLEKNDYVTQSFIISFFYPSSLSQLISDPIKIKSAFHEHTSQIASPLEITAQFLEEIKQKVFLSFDSKDIIDFSNLDKIKHNFHILTENLIKTETPLAKSIDFLTKFCVNTFSLEGITIYRFHLEEVFVLNTVNTEFSSVSVNEYYLSQSERKNEYSYFSILHPKNGEELGSIVVRTSYLEHSSIEKEDFQFFADEFGKLLTHHHLEDKLLLVQKLTEELLDIPDIKSLFETVARFVQQVFKTEFKLFSTLLYNPETESLDFITQRGYSSDFNVKSIALNSANSVVAKAAREKTILNVKNVDKIKYYLRGDISVKSELALPMIYNNQLIGILNVESPKKKAFTETFHIPLMEMIRDLSVSTYIRLSSIKKIGGFDLV